MTGQERERIYFEFYAALQPISLARLATELREAGIEVSTATLKRYSAACRWQERLRERGERALTKLDAEAVRRRLDHVERSVQLGDGMRLIAGTGLSRLAGNPARLEDLSPHAIARLAETGTRISDEALQFEVTFDAVARQVVNYLVPARGRLGRGRSRKRHAHRRRGDLGVRLIRLRLWARCHAE